MQRTRAWLWGLGSLVVVLAVALVVLLLTRNDNSEKASTTSTTTTTVAPTTTTTTVSPTTTTTTPTATTVPYPAITDNPQTYAQYLYVAWQNGSRTEAAKVASADAVNQMFSQPYPAKGPYTLGFCGPAAGSLYCTFNGQGGATIQMQVRTLTGGLPIQVEQVQFNG